MRALPAPFACHASCEHHSHPPRKPRQSATKPPSLLPQRGDAPELPGAQGAEEAPKRIRDGDDAAGSSGKRQAASATEQQLESERAENLNKAKTRKAPWTTFLNMCRSEGIKPIRKPTKERAQSSACPSTK